MTAAPRFSSRSFSGSCALVTGGSSGIGREVAIGLARGGARVAFSYHSRAEAAEALAEEIRSGGGDAFAFQLDLADSAALESGFAAAVGRLGGRLDILVHNAGEWMKKTPVAECGEELWDRLIAVNLTSTFLLCRAAARLMLPCKSGSIVNVSSVVARTGGGGGTVPYCVSKAGVNTFTRGLARELAGAGIRVNAVAPGLVDTPMMDINFAAEQKASLGAAIPIGRMAHPQELASAILFLASSEASYITGEVMEVNGGVLMD